jgi:hypothetical protein
VQAIIPYKCDVNFSKKIYFSYINKVFRICFGKTFNILLPGHSSGLQGPVSVAEPIHGAPPLDAVIASALVRSLLPPPHVAEQGDHSSYSPHTQSTASTYENKRTNNNNITMETYKNISQYQNGFRTYLVYLEDGTNKVY